MLMRAALRICCVQALLGATFAEDSVRDSEITVIDPESNPDDSRPFIAVYTDDQAGSTLSITFEVGVTARMTIKNEDDQDVLIDHIPPTDAGIEMVLDAIESQIHTVFHDEENAWAELYRVGLDVETSDIASVRGASKTEDGERFAGRQITISAAALSDPAFGQNIVSGGFWDRFLTKLDADQGLTNFADTFRSLLGVGETVPNWKLLQRSLALSRDSANALGITNLYGDSATPISFAEIEDENPGQGVE